MSSNEKEAEPTSAMPATLSLRAFVESHAEIVRQLRDYDPRSLIAIVGGMLTMPEWQASNLRLEVLQHLVVASSDGARQATAADLALWLTELGEGWAGRLEDPSEDVFASRVLTSSGDYIVFEGLYEGSAFYLQRFVNVLRAMPNRAPFSRLKSAADSLLRLSGEVAKRSGVAAFVVGQTIPLQTVPIELLAGLNEAGNHVRFSHDQLDALGIVLADLGEFTFDTAAREALFDEHVGQSTLERYPIIAFDRQIVLAHPSAVSIAIRRLVIEFAIASKTEHILYGAYTRELAETFAGMPLLGGASAPNLPFEKQGEIYVANLVRNADVGRVLHLLFVVDDFKSYPLTGFIGFDRNTSRLGDAIEASIAHVHSEVASKAHFKEGVTLLVLCTWGRPVAIEFEPVRDARWRIQDIGAEDLAALSWEPKFSPLSLWRLLDSRDRLKALNLNLVNVNGILNLYAWSEELEGHLIPHEQMSDDHDAAMHFEMMITQNGLLEVRKRLAESWDVHTMRTWDGRDVVVRRDHGEYFFEEDRAVPLYVSMDDLDAGRLVAVFESTRRNWWTTTELVGAANRELQYRLWHATTVWLKRAVPILEDAIAHLPNSEIVWLCRFEDASVTVEASHIPNRLEAQKLLEVNARSNVIEVTARQGFLESFRAPENVGERLLVESLVSGSLRLAHESHGEDRVEFLTGAIVPDQWARDMHM